MGKLYTERSRLDLFFAAYYVVLLEEPTFCYELQTLLDQLDKGLDPIVSKLKERRFGLTRAQRDLVISGSTLSKTDAPEWKAGINPAALKSKLDPNIVFAACESAALKLNDFIQTWKLPFDSKEDLYDYYSRVRLRQAKRATFQRKIRKGLDFDSYGDWISIPEFYYDPTQNDSKWLENQIANIGQEIKRRARAIENEARKQGLKPMPTRWRPKGGRVSAKAGEFLSEDLLKTAKIYYLREVRKFTWGKIAKDCGCSRSQAVERRKNFVQALSQSVEEYLNRFSK